jgi:hypothetical protein
VAGEHGRRLLEIAALIVAGLSLHNVGRDQVAFLEVFGKAVLPDVRA